MSTGEFNNLILSEDFGQCLGKTGSIPTFDWFSNVNESREIPQCVRFLEAYCCLKFYGAQSMQFMQNVLHFRWILERD